MLLINVYTTQNMFLNIVVYEKFINPHIIVLLKLNDNGRKQRSI